MSKFPSVGFSAKPVPHQIKSMDALAASFDSAGLRYRMAYNSHIPEKVAVVWGWGRAKEIRKTNPEAIILCLDHGYTWNRKQYVNTAWSTPEHQFGLNGFGEHAIVDDGGERSRAHGWWDELKPVRGCGGSLTALLLGQVYGDAMIVDHVEDYGAWLRERSEQLQANGYSVAFRPHPNMVLRGNVERYGNVGSRTFGTLAEDLATCCLATAMNSNALVQAYTEGVPFVQAFNRGSMLWPLIGEPGACADTTPANREKWWARLAYCQWTYAELADGTWMRYHRPILERLVEGGPLRPWWQTTEDYEQ